jgi:hypothetical protein
MATSASLARLRFWFACALALSALGGPSVASGDNSVDDGLCAKDIRAAIATQQQNRVPLPCWHIGPVAIGMTEPRVEETLGKADFGPLQPEKISTAIYVFPRDLKRQLANHPVKSVSHSELSVTYQNGRVVKIYANFGGARLPYEFATVATGMPVKTVADRFGNFTSMNSSRDEGQYGRIPLVFEIDTDTDSVGGIMIAADPKWLGLGQISQFWLEKDKATGLINGYRVTVSR